MADAGGGRLDHPATSNKTVMFQKIASLIGALDRSITWKKFPCKALAELARLSGDVLKWLTKKLECEEDGREGRLVYLVEVGDELFTGLRNYFFEMAATIQEMLFYCILQKYVSSILVHYANDLAQEILPSKGINRERLAAAIAQKIKTVITRQGSAETRHLREEAARYKRSATDYYKEICSAKRNRDTLFAHLVLLLLKRWRINSNDISEEKIELTAKRLVLKLEQDFGTQLPDLVTTAVAEAESGMRRANRALIINVAKMTEVIEAELASQPEPTTRPLLEMQDETRRWNEQYVITMAGINKPVDWRCPQM